MEKDTARYFECFVDHVFWLGFMTKTHQNVTFCPCSSKNKNLYLENPVVLYDISNYKILKGLNLFSLIRHLVKKQHYPLHTGTLKYLEMKYSVNPRLFPTCSQDYKKAIAYETAFIDQRKFDEK